MNQTIQSICVFCGSADGVDPRYYQAADAMGQALAQAGIRLVYGAGKTGLMGAVADGVLRAGGRATGIVNQALNLPHLIHAGLTELEVVENMHVRKARMHALADAYIALPGGLGTFDELFETITWAQLGMHAKPIGVLNTLGYFGPLLTMVQHALEQGFIYDEHRSLLLASEDPTRLLDMLGGYQTPDNLSRWVSRE